MSEQEYYKKGLSCGHVWIHYQGERCPTCGDVPCESFTPAPTPAETYEPLCWKCGDRGFVIVPYGVSGSGTLECTECKGRNRKRYAETHKPTPAEGDELFVPPDPTAEYHGGEEIEKPADDLIGRAIKLLHEGMKSTGTGTLHYQKMREATDCLIVRRLIDTKAKTIAADRIKRAEEMTKKSPDA